MRLKLKAKNKIILSFESLMEDYSIISNELSLLALNIRREVINVLDSFFSFLKKYEIKKANMIFLMSNPRFKSLPIVSSFVGREQGVALVKEYDRKTLYLMLVKWHEHLHPLVRLDTNCADQDIFLTRLRFGYF
jgi:sensor histidine kinase YesM